MGAEVEAEFAPSDQLVEKALGGGRHVPPAFAGAIGAKGDFGGLPFFFRGQGGENFVGGDVAEVKVRREAASGGFGGAVAGCEGGEEGGGGGAAGWLGGLAGGRVGGDWRLCRQRGSGPAVGD